jgi:dTDP-4-amino-4,6-dideoxygalactose transaminase
LCLPKETAVVAFNGFTCYAVYKAVRNAGCAIVYLDIHDRDLHFSPEVLQSALQKNQAIKVVIIQNTLGYPCDIEKLSKSASKNIILIEDLAHSIGARYTNNQEAGML